MARRVTETGEPADVAEADAGNWRYLVMPHSTDGKNEARDWLAALPTARCEETPDGYRVWAGACDRPPR
jgi:hypothetical protein